jgi:hypothetical protein
MLGWARWLARASSQPENDLHTFCFGVEPNPESRE